ncbi:MAG: Hsp20/alpha crystallin family protein [Parabacteroides sp.]
MSQIRKYNNYNQNWVPGFFNDFFDNDWIMRAHTTAPAINVSEDDQEYKLEIAAPGLTKEDFNVHLSEDDELVINMEKKTESQEGDKSNKKYLRREFSYTKFEQSFVLPDNVDKEKISANVTDGVLSIVLPKETPEQKAKVNRSIEIQ